VESLTVQLKDAYLRELEMRKALEAGAAKGKERAVELCSCRLNQVDT
jgi:hypothetical protein